MVLDENSPLLAMLLKKMLLCTVTCAPSQTRMAPPQPLVVFVVELSWKLQFVMFTIALPKRGQSAPPLPAWFPANSLFVMVSGPIDQIAPPLWGESARLLRKWQLSMTSVPSAVAFPIAPPSPNTKAFVSVRFFNVTVPALEKLRLKIRNWLAPLMVIVPPPSIVHGTVIVGRTPGDWRRMVAVPIWKVSVPPPVLWSAVSFARSWAGPPVSPG